jgi:hypothetical protein
MKAVIFSFIPAVETSMIASTRIARFMRDELQIPLIWTEDIADHTDLDALIIINGAFAFCRYLEPLATAILGAKRIIWIMNDYSIVPPINNGSATSPFRKAFVTRKSQNKPHLDFWSACEYESKLTPLSTYVNWPSLSMQKKVLRGKAKHDDVVYFGSYRKGGSPGSKGSRVNSFDIYFKNPRYNLTISSPDKKFQEIYKSPRILHVGKQDDLVNWLGERGLGLYLQDDYSNRNYHSPGDRFYEMLSAGLPMVFHQATGMTLRKAGFEIDNYVVNKSLDVARKLDTRNVIAKEQHGLWFEKANKQREELPAVIKTAWKKLNDN